MLNRVVMNDLCSRHDLNAYSRNNMVSGMTLSMVILRSFMSWGGDVNNLSRKLSSSLKDVSTKKCSYGLHWINSFATRKHSRSSSPLYCFIACTSRGRNRSRMY